MALSKYERTPWPIRSAFPILGLLGVIFFYHKLFNLNFMEFLGVTFSVITCFYLILGLFRFIYHNWLGTPIDLRTLGSWAVVTGATQGIGKSYAFALAKRGLNIVIISRSPDKLAKVSEEIRANYQVDVKVISADFTKGMEIYEDIQKQLFGLEVGVLINNVGICYPYPEYYSDLPDMKFSQDLINCNILSVALMTSLILPGMVERRKGVIVNVGSMSSCLGSPFLALYGASKSFVDKFTQDLEWEYKEFGIIFQVVIPGYVVSNMSKLRSSSFFVPTPDDFVEGALNSIGLQSRTTVWLPHHLLYLFVTLGMIFRKEGCLYITHYIAKKFWFHGKKVTIYRNSKKQT